ncbi:MAG: SDR family oxidoreductase [Flavobacteriales bacterium]|nr:SDR family oxidoreductase [Flavobacteriales bacterium]
MERRRVMVTGAGRGVGRATAKALAVEHGCEVIAVSRSASALEDLVHSSRGGPGVIHPVTMDINDDDAGARLLAHMGRGRLHGLVHNAGAMLRVEWGLYGRNELAGLFHTNLVVPMILSQSLASCMAGDPPGHIVHIGSMGGFQDSTKFPGLAAYSASKAALACLAQCLAEEMKDLQVRSNCLALGAVDTEMLQEAFPGYKAHVSSTAMGLYVADFVLHGHGLYNGKVLPVAVSTP